VFNCDPETKPASSQPCNLVREYLWSENEWVCCTEDKIIVTTFENGNIHYGEGFESLSIYEHDGREYIQGLFNRKTRVIDNQMIFILPVG
jgi:hypothetical protein